MNGVKQDDAIRVKDEPIDVGTPMSTISDEVEEEDTGELSMPKDEASYPAMFLTRVPKELWHVLSETTQSQDEPIQIGTIKFWTKENGKQDVRLYLKYNLPGLEMVPKDYEMSVTNMDPQNTFVFTEKDLPGYKPGAFSNRNAHNRSDRVQKRNNYRSRRSIPKKTALAGHSRHEFMLHPIENEEYRRVQKVKEQAALAAEQRQPNIFADDERIMNPLDVNGRQWDTFTRAKPRAGQQQVKRQLNKAERLPQNVLIDKLVDCFRRYAYWHFKTLVREVHQPEAYVKETLNRIAELVKSGPYANTYMLAAQYRETLRETTDLQETLNRGEAAPEIAGDEADAEGDLKDDGDSDVMEMEDVVMS